MRSLSVTALLYDWRTLGVCRLYVLVCLLPLFYVGLSCCETCQNLLTSQSPYLLVFDASWRPSDRGDAGVPWMSTPNARSVYPANLLIKIVSDLDDYRLFWHPLNTWKGSRSLWGLLWSFSLFLVLMFSLVETWTSDIINSGYRTAWENRTQQSQTNLKVWCEGFSGI